MQSAHRLADVSHSHRLAPAPPTADETLIAAIAKGDKNAMQALFARYSAKIFRFVLRRTGNVALAEDVVSEVFLEVWRSAGRFEGRSKVATWLLAIARYKAIHTTRRAADVPLDDASMAAAVDGADDPETLVHQEDRRRILRTCLAQLSSAHREIIDLVYYHGNPVAKVARIVAAPVGTVKTRMFYARKRMAELLHAAGIDGV